jgi:putative ABC transport system permease protein
MKLLRLALLSLRNRWLTALLTVLAIAVSVTLFLGVEKVRNGAKASFAGTVSGTDLIVGARTGAVQLLLYSVFRIGNATNNITLKSLEDIAARPEVAWIVPLSLGDSHRGFRVLGTTAAYFDRYRYRQGKSLAFQAGGPFDDLFDAVVGADVAATLGYKVGDPLVVQHGIGTIGGEEHADKPFRIAGILAKTGTPVDRTVHVSLDAIEAIHIDWHGGRRQPGLSMSADQVRKLDLRPKAVTAALIGVTSKIETFKLQRFINSYPEEPLVAVLPGVALQELWSLMDVAEVALRLVSGMVIVTALLGMVTMILTTLNERRREMAILRAVGASPRSIMTLLVFEAGVLTAAGTLAGCAVLYLALLALRPEIDARFGLYLAIDPPQLNEVLTLGAIVAAGCIAGLLPAWRAYRLSLADGMTVKS